MGFHESSQNPTHVPSCMNDWWCIFDVKYNWKYVNINLNINQFLSFGDVHDDDKDVDDNDNKSIWEAN